MFKLIGSLAGTAAVFGLGVFGYKRYLGSDDTFSQVSLTHWYAPAPKITIGTQTSYGPVVGMAYQKGQWVYQFQNGVTTPESQLVGSAATLYGARQAGIRVVR